MSPANRLSVAIMLVAGGIIAWQLVRDRRTDDPPDLPTRQWRFRIAWEVRGLVMIIAGPYAAGMFLGYVSTDYILPLLLFLVAGFLIAGMIAPSGLRIRR
jgi:hypothetical protein